MKQKLNKFKLKDILASDEASAQYYNSLRWKGKRLCPRCMYEEQYSLKSNRYGCKKCRYNFSEFTGTYLGILRIKPSLITHILHLFVAEQSAYTISQHLKCHKSTIERTFGVFRQAIYDNSLLHIHQELKLYREKGLNERILDVIRQENHYLEFKHDIDGKEYLIFAIYDMKELVVAFPVKVENETLNKLLVKYKKFKDFNTHGSFYQKNDHIAYAMLDMEKREMVAYNDVFRGTEGIYIGLEGFWSYVEKWLYHYRGVPKQYFHLYLKEIEFRFNLRFNYCVMFSELSKLLVKPFPTNR